MTPLFCSGTRIPMQLLPSRINVRGWVAAQTGMVPSSLAKRSKTAVICQPDPDEMLTNLADSTGRYFHTSCRDLLAIWCRPFYLRLMLAAWRGVPEQEFADLQARVGYNEALRRKKARASY